MSRQRPSPRGKFSPTYFFVLSRTFRNTSFVRFQAYILARPRRDLDPRMKQSAGSKEELADEDRGSIGVGA